MRRPSFQFYPADWRNNANLRRCSWEARGVWVEVMGLMHDSDAYGLLHWPLKEISQALGAPLKLVRELAAKDVMKGCDANQICEPLIYTPRSGRKDGEPVLLVPAQAGPIWYSSRMVRDEYVRSIRGEYSRFDQSPDASPKPPIGEASKTTSKPRQSDGSTSSSSATHSSVPNGTGGTPPTDRDLLFSNGVPLLTASGVSEKNARSMLAGLAKVHGDAAVFKVLTDCAQQRPIEPVSWIQAALKPGPRANRQEAQESRNHATAQSWADGDTHAAV